MGLIFGGEPVSKSMFFWEETSTTLQFNVMVGRKLMLLGDACWKDDLWDTFRQWLQALRKCQKLQFGVGAKTNDIIGEMIDDLPGTSNIHTKCFLDSGYDSLL